MYKQYQKKILKKLLQDAKHGRAYVFKLDYSDALLKLCRIVIGIANSKLELIKKLKQRKVPLKNDIIQ